MGHGFFSFDQSRKTLEWNFPDIENAIVPVAGYLLSLWDPNDPRWTLTERQVLVTCAGLLVQRDTGATPEPPEGYVSDIAFEDVPVSPLAIQLASALRRPEEVAVGTIAGTAPLAMAAGKPGCTSSPRFS